MDVSYVANVFTNPIFIGIILVYVVLFFYMSNEADSTNNTCYFIMIIIIGIIISLLYFSNFFTSAPALMPPPPLPLSVPLPNIPVSTNEVFNIPGNYYTYDESNMLCKAYNARLATYDEVEQSYNSGADWCNYGWSDKQLALFPTQKSTYNKLQKIEGHQQDCGRPGVNGGFIANPNVKFGVNCFGKKPKMTDEEADLMATSAIYPKSQKDIELEKKLQRLKDKKDEILISPFNHNRWNKF
jgi:hypothetical protein